MEQQPETTYRRSVMHLRGGLRGDLDDKQFRLFPTGRGQGASFELDAPAKSLEVMHSLGLFRIGDEEVLVTNGLPLRIWHPDCPSVAIASWTESPSSRWQGIACSAREAGDKKTADLSQHISFALTAASLRLRDISDSYAFQLEYALANGILGNQKFANLEILTLFLCCHSFLVEACSARDYLGKFLGQHVYGVVANSMANLLKRKSPLPGHPIEMLLTQANDKASPDGWMTRLTEYRNIITHRAPIGYLGPHPRITFNMMQVNANFLLPEITFEVPDNPFDKSTGSLCDALQLFHSHHDMLMRFADMVTAHSPYSPTYRSFDESNIIEIEMLRVQDVR